MRLPDRVGANPLILGAPETEVEEGRSSIATAAQD
jgi:hypothetical protein